MRKADLRKLRTLNATKEMMEKAAVNELGEKVKEVTDLGCRRIIKRKYGMFLRCQYLGQILKVAVFLPEQMQKGIKAPYYEIFLNPEGGEFITRERKTGKENWKTARIDNLNFDKCYAYWEYFYYSEKNAWINREGSRTIKKVLDVSKGGYEGILEFQKRVNEEKIQEQRRKETRPWDEDMALVPELPTGFSDWQKKEGIPEHYIFYRYEKGGAKTGYCSHCEKNVEIRSPKHGKAGTCPKCRAKITYRATGKIKALATSECVCQIVQEIENGLVVRTFIGKKYYRDTVPEKPRYKLQEIERVFHRGSRVDGYSWDLYKNVETRWVKDNYYRVRNGKGPVYIRNMRYLEKSILKRSALPVMVREGRKLNCSHYLIQESENPVIELLAKAGLTRMAEEMMDCADDEEILDKAATQLTKILKIDTSRLNRLKKMDAGLVHLEWMKEEKQLDTQMPDALIDYFGKKDIHPKRMKFIRNRMSYIKIYNYIMRQQSLAGESVGRILQTWADYLNMAAKAKMDTTKEMIYKPKNLKSAHSEVILLLQEEDMEKTAAGLANKWPLVNEVCGTLEKYEMHGEEYSIVAPAKGIIDIVREGTALHHCIHTCDFYFDRIGKRESYLLFLRRTACIDVPYYTLEVEPSGNIRQKRTTGDNQNEDFQDAVSWLKKWQIEIKKRLTKEDKALGEKSSEARIGEMKELRKNGNKVWHGKLAGRLLADILEEDFMEVV